jgi:polyhydroxybutyrate depolymerase
MPCVLSCLALLGLTGCSDGKDKPTSSMDAGGRSGDGKHASRDASVRDGAAIGDGVTTTDGSGDGGPRQSDGGPRQSDGGDLTSPPPPACKLAGDLGPGDHELDHDFGGLSRIVQLHVPPSYDGKHGLPLVFSLHPFVLGGPLLGIWQTESAMNAKGDEAGFIVVTPSGTGVPSAWNAGKECCGQASTDMVDDVGFILHLIDYVSERVCVDKRRVYSAGMSNGGYLSSRLACEASDRIAAIAPVVGHLSAEFYPCKLSRPVPVLQITGSEDSLERRTLSYEQWVEMDGCKDKEEETFNDGPGPGTARCVTHNDCKSGVEVTHCVVQAGHCWHSQVPMQATPGCMPTKSFHSPDQIWDFFSRFSLP